MSKQSIEVRKRKLMRSAATRATAKYTCGGLPRKVQPPKPVSRPRRQERTRNEQARALHSGRTALRDPRREGRGVRLAVRNGVIEIDPQARGYAQAVHR